MLPETIDLQISKTNPEQNTGAGRSSSRAASSPKRYFSHLDLSDVPDPTWLNKRTCCSPVSGQAADCSAASREQLGGKGMYLQRMKKAGLSVPPFECVTAQVMSALEQQPLDNFACYLPGIDRELKAETCLKNIREHLNALPPSEQSKRDNWLLGLAQFVASDDYYEQVKDSEAARHIRTLRHQLDKFSRSQPVIVRSSGINEDNYGDAQAGKYLSEVQGEEDVLRTCLKVMASGYRPEVCSEGIPQPMALIIQQCIDCRYGGVVMSFQSFQEDTIRVEYTRGQPRGAVAGQSGNRPHRIDIYREDHKEEAHIYQYFPGTISSHFVLHKNNNGYSETIIANADAQSDDSGQKLTDKMVSDLRDAVTKLEDLLLCPVDVEFAIDHQGSLFLLQVRPVTRLSGGMDFAMPIPIESLAIGEGISEGFCTGPLWLAKKTQADSMPKGAIVVARQAEDWMLEPGLLKRAGGFVLAEAGFNDHVAILMKQEKIALMRAGAEYAAVIAQDGQQATLACARFNGEPGAFIVVGDLAGKLASHRNLSSAFSDVLPGKAVPSRADLSPSEDTLCQVASGFQWLTDQNARLLAFFASGGGLDCLENPIKLSMSPQRSELLAGTRENISRLIYGAEKLLQGYEAFLRLAGDSRSSRVEPLLDEFLHLSNRFEMLKQTILSGLKSIIMPMQAAEDGQLSPVTFRHWLADCDQLQSFLQALNPWRAEQVQSVHELIFAVHQRFVNALAPITLASSQGRVSREKRITYIDHRTPSETAPLLSPACKATLEGLLFRKAIVVCMNEALIVNLKLGTHVSLIELLDRAEGGKGRTLRLKFSDSFDSDDGSESPGKLKRMWFLVELLKAFELNKNAGSMKTSCNAVAGEIIVECTRMRTRENMQEAFVKLTKALYSLVSLDRFLSRITLFEGGRWSFNWLAQRLDSDASAEANRFAFQHCLFSMVNSIRDGIAPECYPLLSKHQQEFMDQGRCLVKSKDNVWELLMSDQVSEDILRELLHHFLLSYPGNASQWVELLYPHLKDQYYVIKRSCSYSLEFDVPPMPLLGGQKERVRSFLLKHGIECASQRIRNDKDLMLAALEIHPYSLKYVSEKLRSDKQVVLTAVTGDGSSLQYASTKLRDNEEVVKAAIKHDSAALEYASDRIRSDKKTLSKP
ncbi:DUF4116 domain-containing protein [Endozoicomonas sp. ALC020]|uniref:DUF4116 domain-containing protein n=1 Tax=unclassified Endozoicomonas TaxID=2644528 RepID=UPI003BB03C04